MKALLCIIAVMFFCQAAYAESAEEKACALGCEKIRAEISEKYNYTMRQPRAERDNKIIKLYNSLYNSMDREFQLDLDNKFGVCFTLRYLKLKIKLM